MNLPRLLVHPLLLNRRSRFVLLLLTTALAIVLGLLWWRFFSVLSTAGVRLQGIPSVDNSTLTLLLSPYFHALLALFSLFIAAAVTAQRTVGPVKRIEEWIRDWEAGFEVTPLRIRKGDVYEDLVQVINALYAKSRSGGKEKSG